MRRGRSLGLRRTVDHAPCETIWIVQHAKRATYSDLSARCACGMWLRPGLLRRTTSVVSCQCSTQRSPACNLGALPPIRSNPVLVRCSDWFANVAVCCCGRRRLVRCAVQHWSAPLCGVLVHAVSAWRVWWSVAACRQLWNNNLGGKLPAQYSALTNLQVLCVAPDPAFAPIRSDPGGGCALRLSRCAQRSSPASLRGLRA